MCLKTLLCVCVCARACMRVCACVCFVVQTSTELEQKFQNNPQEVVEFTAGSQTYTLSLQGEATVTPPAPTHHRCTPHELVFSDDGGRDGDVAREFQPLGRKGCWFKPQAHCIII